MLKNILALLQQEFSITARQAFSWASPLFIFIIVVCLFPLGERHA